MYICPNYFLIWEGLKNESTYIYMYMYIVCVHVLISVDHAHTYISIVRMRNQVKFSRGYFLKGGGISDEKLGCLPQYWRNVW